MSERAIKELKVKFIWSAFLAFLLVMLIMGATIYLVNYHSTMLHINTVLDFMLENSEEIDLRGNNNIKSDSGKQNYFDQFLDKLFRTGIDSSPEYKYSSGHFYVYTDGGGTITYLSVNEFSGVSEETAMKCAKKVVNSGHTSGNVGDFYFDSMQTDSGLTYIFLDCTLSMENLRRLMNTIILLVAFGALLDFSVVHIIAGRMVMPEVKSAERQKQFITDAGHELKTPLSVIRANTELDMMMNGENDLNQSTLRQVDRMTGLIHDLITLAKADESAREENITDVDMSETVTSAAENLIPVATNKGKHMVTDIAEGVRMKGDKGRLTQLVTLLADNAIKYCDDGGTIRVELSRKGKNVRLAVYNDFAEGNEKECSKYFQRFYRGDSSHNIDRGGYGIGLSIAENIVSDYKGSIKSSWSAGIICFECRFRGL